MRWPKVGRFPDAPMNRLLNLKVAKDRKGMAPNKPLLVLAILDLVEAGARRGEMERWSGGTPGYISMLR